jgi:hypothetical protein
MISPGNLSLGMRIDNGGAGRSERLHENAVAALRRLMAEPVEGFATMGASVEPIAPPAVYRVTTVVVLCNAPTEIYAAIEELTAHEEVFPIAATGWEPHPWTRPPVAEIDVNMVDGLDLSAPLGLCVEISVLSERLPYGVDGELIEIDTALVLAVQGWRLLVESLEYSNYPSISATWP